MSKELIEILKDTRGAYANHRERELEAALESALSRLEAAEYVCERAEYLDENMTAWYITNDAAKLREACTDISRALEAWRQLDSRKTEGGK